MVGTNECRTHITALICTNMGSIFEVEGKTFFQLRRERLSNLTRISGFPAWEEPRDRSSGDLKDIKTWSSASRYWCRLLCLHEPSSANQDHSLFSIPP